MKEIEKASAKDDKKGSQPAKGLNWRWPWGRLPEKADVPPQEKIEATPESKIAILPPHNTI
jgi:hypothetical protein